MVSWKTKITGSNPNSATLYGGQTVDFILDYFSNVDLSVAGVDTNGIGDIATYTYFNTNTLNLWDSDRSNRIRFQTPDYTSNKTITFPGQAAMQASDEILLKDSVQIITNKIMDYNLNTFQNFPLEAQGFTSTSETTLTNKTIGDGLTFDVITQPSNPAADEIILYSEAIDGDNDGIFAIVKKGGSFVKLQLG